MQRILAIELVAFTFGTSGRRCNRIRILKEYMKVLPIDNNIVVAKITESREEVKRKSLFIMHRTVTVSLYDTHGRISYEGLTEGTEDVSLPTLRFIVVHEM